MRCKFGNTKQCKAIKWSNELLMLRQIVLNTPLIETIKWSVPVYTYKGKNVVSINALKNSANINFFKGVLLKDEFNLLEQQGQLQSDRIIKFVDLNEIKKKKEILHHYILEAINIEEKGEKVIFNKNPEPLPDELVFALDQDALFKKSFFALSASKQRGYIIQISKPKNSQNRQNLINKYKEQILNGIGINDKYIKKVNEWKNK